MRNTHKVLTAHDVIQSMRNKGMSIGTIVAVSGLSEQAVRSCIKPENPPATTSTKPLTEPIRRWLVKRGLRMGTLSEIVAALTPEAAIWLAHGVPANSTMADHIASIITDAHAAETAPEGEKPR